MIIVDAVDCIKIMMISINLSICSGSPGNFVSLLKAFMQIMYLLSMMLVQLLDMLSLMLALVLHCLEVMLYLCELSLTDLSSLLSCHHNLVGIGLCKRSIPG